MTKPNITSKTISISSQSQLIPPSNHQTIKHFHPISFEKFKVAQPSKGSKKIKLKNSIRSLNYFMYVGSSQSELSGGVRLKNVHKNTHNRCLFEKGSAVSLEEKLFIPIYLSFLCSYIYNHSTQSRKSIQPLCLRAFLSRGVSILGLLLYI